MGLSLGRDVGNRRLFYHRQATNRLSYRCRHSRIANHVPSLPQPGAGVRRTSQRLTRQPRTVRPVRRTPCQAWRSRKRMKAGFARQTPVSNRWCSALPGRARRCATPSARGEPQSAVSVNPLSCRCRPSTLAARPPKKNTPIEGNGRKRCIITVRITKNFRLLWSAPDGT